jgi:hypothetical protein
MTDDATPHGSTSDALTLLVYALDEMRETTSLLPVAELTRGTDRPWWRNLFFAFARSRAEVGAGLAVQYLSENLERAEGHWREATSLLGQLQLEHRDNAVVEKLGADLQTAGLDDVLAQLDDRAIPHGSAETGRHLGAVVAKIRYCEHIVLTARSKLLLERIRNE